MLDLTPSPIAIQIGPLAVHWYGIAYAVGLGAAYWLLRREARFRGQDPELVFNGMLVVAIAALIGGRLYHVIDQWQLYKSDLLSIVLPPYSGLGVYGGLLTGTLAGVAYVRWKRHSLGVWADIVAPSLFLMQAIDESLSGLLGMLVLLYLGRRFRDRLRPGDLLLVFFVWYGTVRFVLESLKSNNWLFFGIPTAQVAAGLSVLLALAILLVRHSRPPRATPEPEQTPPPDARATPAPENG